MRSSSALPADRAVTELTPERWQEVKAVLATALELDASARAFYLDEICRDDADLRAQVEQLIRANAMASARFLAAPAPGRGWASDLVSRGRFTGRSRGPYRLGRRVAAGGMDI